MNIKKCVGVIIYNNKDEIFLMSSPKWKKWLIPGGRIEEGETEEEALRREIKEEMNIELEKEQREHDRVIADRYATLERSIIRLQKNGRITKR